ncbi:MAG TPA: 3-oxoacyl-ACP reductase family protein [Verrucomicrobiae bacterium]|nr:3-oxoacyl-ACP reductase family protein [Verrucomicrobiae bacterium]
MRLAGKIILVTGASKGIGRTLAVGLAREGADIIVNYNTDKAGAHAVAREIEQLGRKSLVVQANIANVAAIKKMFAVIYKNFGRLDSLINNAGITGWTSLFEITEGKWDEVINTNLRGTFFCALEAARMMRGQKSGSIVNISTNCAELGVRNLVAYASSKGGIHAMTKPLAVELAPFNIRVNTFAPGPIKIDRNVKDDPNFEKAWGAMVPLGRVGEPEEMIGPAVFLASDESSFMTGQTFYVDGGWTISGKIPMENMEKAMARNK